jgi:hypothetical protein
MGNACDGVRISNDCRREEEMAERFGAADVTINQGSRNAEMARLEELLKKNKPWRKWGTYLSERQWGTVREDYSTSGAAWDYFPHDQARSRAYRWGEDGIGGLCDEGQHLCLGMALWNGNDPILKERLFGLTNLEGNHGEDVKELYYYLDATPTNSYARMLYKYPQAAYPYERLIEENRRRGLAETEFELIDTGVFTENRYFDVFIEYAKAEVEDLLMRVTVHNRGPRTAPLWVLPQLWFRNTWSWANGPKPTIARKYPHSLMVTHSQLGSYQIDFEPPTEFLFCDNETNLRRLYGIAETKGFFKDAFHEYLVDGTQSAVNRQQRGTKAAALYKFDIPSGASSTVRLRLRIDKDLNDAFLDFEQVFTDRIREADDFYAELQSGIENEEVRRIQRQAFAGMLWNKQCYHYDVRQWLDGDRGQPAPPPERKSGRNHQWTHVNIGDVLSMPDKWEYPWFAAWDLAFHCVTHALIDPDFAKRQLILLAREWYMHPNGQLPAFEWAFGNVNPPVHALAAWRIYRLEQMRTGKGDLVFLERVFHKLMLNFTWWVNRRDAHGRNIFQGGFLGLDNIGVFDRSAPLPTGGVLNQSDATAWMAMYSLNLMRIALELAQHNHVYEDIATKFFEHFLYIARAMTDIAGESIGLWDEEDHFYYSVLSMPNGQNFPLRLRSMVGLIPLFAVEILEQELLHSVPGFQQRLESFLDTSPNLTRLVSRYHEPGSKNRRLLSLARAFRMKKILARMLDENEFLSEYGVRALSRYHLDHPFAFEYSGNRYEVKYEPGESQTRTFGGNSNWRGPIWLPVNYMIVESLRRFYDYYGDNFKVECPTGSGKMLTLWQVAEEISTRLARLCLRDQNGRRPVLGPDTTFQTDPNFRDYILFYEYFDGDTGRGLGASHQTGWTGLLANLIYEHGVTASPSVL